MANEEATSSPQGEPAPGPQDLARLIAGIQPPVDSLSPAPEPAAPSQPDLGAQIAALQTELAAVRARQEAAPAPSPADWSAASAQGTLAAFEQLRQRRQWEEQQRQALQPPQMPPDEALLTDPRAIKFAISSQVDHALRSYDAAVRPQLQEAAELKALLGPMMNQVAATADAQARSLAEADGIDQETFNRLLPDAIAMIANAPQTTPGGRFQMRSDPGILLSAVHMARRQRGLPVTPAAPPTSIGVTHATSQGGRGRQVSLPGADMVETMLGVKFSKEERGRVARSAALSELVNASLEGIG